MDDEDINTICLFLKDVQTRRIAGAIDRVRSRMVGECDQVILSGSGLFLAVQILTKQPKFENATIHKLSEIFTPEVAEAACAVALTRLAEERL